ncbi:MAG TPA: patatin-like phospholipase family protein [Flavisolibacter sp.]|nr:patatin-like phospholipase family protein [Flavisolibacter sp.]
MAKRAIVISGGGSKGAFAVGVLKRLAFEFPQMEFDIFVGTSTGALISPLAALGDISLLESLYTNVKTEDIVSKGNVLDRFMNEVSLFDAAPLGRLVMNHYNDATCGKIFQSGKEIFLVTTCLQTTQAVVWTSQEPLIITSYEMMKAVNATELRRAIVASANQPVFMQPIEIREGTPVRQYVDGGVREYLGMQIAIEAGADEIFAISMAPLAKDPVDKRYTKTMEVLGRTLDIFTADVGSNDIKIPRFYNRALRYMNAVRQNMKDDGIAQADIDRYFNVPMFDNFSGKKPIRIHHITPDEPLDGGPGGLDFNPAKMTAMMRKGESMLSSYMASLPSSPDGNV